MSASDPASATGSAAGSAAGAPPEQAQAVFGLWSLTPVEGEGQCRVALGKLAIGDGYGVLVEACTVPDVEGARRWRPVEGGFELLAEGDVLIMRFRATDGGFLSEAGRYRMTRAAMR